MDKHGCYNRVMAPVHRVQEGWTALGTRNMILVPHRNSTDCRFDLRLDHPKCQGCTHQRVVAVALDPVEAPTP